MDFGVSMQAVLGSSSHVNLPTLQKETPLFAISPSTHSTQSTPLSLSLSLSLELSSSAGGDAASSSELWRIPHLHPSFAIFRASFNAPCHCRSFLLLENYYNFCSKLVFFGNKIYHNSFNFIFSFIIFIIVMLVRLFVDCLINRWID